MGLPSEISSLVAERTSRVCKCDSAACLVLCVAAAVLLAGRVFRITERPGHWDEFLFLSRVYEYQRHELYVALQTAHVRLFSWISSRYPAEWEALVAGRICAEISLLAGAAIIAIIASRSGGWFAAGAAIVAFLSFPSVVRHGGSFRADPFLLPLILVSGALLTVARGSNGMRDRPSHVACDGRALLSGAVLGAAIAISIKATLFLPVLLLWSRLRVRQGAALVSAAAAVGIGAIALHRVFDVTPGGQVARRSASTLFSGFLFKPSPDGAGAALFQSLIEAPVQWFLVIIGVLLLFERKGRPKLPLYESSWWDNYRLLGAAAPLVAALLYRNSFDYFLPLVFAFPALIAGTGAELLRRRFGAMPVAILVSAGIFVGGGAVTEQERLMRDRQQLVLAAIHRLFPEPVPYFDCCSMVASFPKVGPFMSTWELSRLKDEGRKNLIAGVSPVPRFVLLNHPALPGHPAPPERPALSGNRAELSPADREFLTVHYVRAGALLLPGFDVELREGEERLFPILVQGRYEVLEGSRCTIDGAPASPEKHLQLAEGAHRAVGIDGGGRCALRMVPESSGDLDIEALFAPPLDRGPILR